MRHAREDYNRIQDPAVTNPELLAVGTSSIAVDEPVFLIRGNDKTAPDTVRYWAARADLAGAPADIVARAREWAVEIEAYQAAHPHRVKAPDLPPDTEKETFGNWLEFTAGLRGIRTAAGLTIRQAARVLGLAPAAYKSLEEAKAAEEVRQGQRRLGEPSKAEVYDAALEDLAGMLKQDPGKLAERLELPRTVVDGPPR